MKYALNPFSESLTRAGPYIFAGLAVALGFRCGLFDIGAEGQIFIGALASVWLGYALVGLPPYIHLPHGLKEVKRGDVLAGTILDISDAGNLVSVDGIKSEGIISGEELAKIPKDVLDDLKVGDVAQTYVVAPSDRNGNVVARFPHRMKPSSPEIVKDVERVLAVK